MSRIEIVLPQIVRTWLNLLYRYGGRGPIDDGGDCSGLLVDYLQSLGEIGDKQDFTAHGIVTRKILEEWWSLHQIKNIRTQLDDLIEFDLIPPGSMLFMDWQDDGKLDHCSLYLGNGLHLHAAGGRSYMRPGYFDSKTRAWPQSAIHADARTKIRPVDWSTVDVVAIPPRMLR